MREALVKKLSSSGSEQEIIETISTAVERLASTGAGPTEIVDAVVEAGRPDLASLAAERHHHARLIASRAEDERLLGSSAPIFEVEKGTLYAVPCGDLGADGFSIFADRLLARVLEKPPRRVVVVTSGLFDRTGLSPSLADLQNDLVVQGIAASIT